MKKYLLPIVGLLLALALTACGTAQNTSTPKLEANGSVESLPGGYGNAKVDVGSIISEYLFDIAHMSY